MKRKTLVILTVVGMLSTSMTSFAGEWRKDEVGWWWLNNDGTYPINEWKWIDGNKDGVSECYYFGSDGYILMDTVIEGYQVTSDGSWVVDGKTMTKVTEIKSQVEESAYTRGTRFELEEGEYLVGYDFDEGTYNINLVSGKGTIRYKFDSGDSDERVSFSKSFDDSKSGSANKVYNGLEMIEEGILIVPKGVIVRLKLCD